MAKYISKVSPISHSSFLVVPKIGTTPFLHFKFGFQIVPVFFTPLTFGCYIIISFALWQKSIPKKQEVITLVPHFGMSRINAKNTKPEMLVRRFLHAHGYRYKLHDKSLPGKQIIVLLKARTVIFVHEFLERLLFKHFLQVILQKFFFR